MIESIKEKNKVLWIAIGTVAEIFGVTPQTIKNWTKQGKFTEDRTVDTEDIMSKRWIEFGRKERGKKTTVIYSRVSGHDQKEDLGDRRRN